MFFLGGKGGLIVSKELEDDPGRKVWWNDPGCEWFWLYDFISGVSTRWELYVFGTNRWRNQVLLQTISFPHGVHFQLPFWISEMLVFLIRLLYRGWYKYFFLWFDLCRFLFLSPVYWFLYFFLMIQHYLDQVLPQATAPVLAEIFGGSCRAGIERENKHQLRGFVTVLSYWW